MIPIEIRFNIIGVPKDNEVPSDTSSAKSTVQVRVLVYGLDAYTESNCFPYRQTPRLKPAAPLEGKSGFQGGFPYT